MAEKNYIDIEQVFWTPKKAGDSIEGVFKYKKLAVGKNKSDVYVLKKEDGSAISVWDSAVLSDKMDLIDIGDDIKIIYLGEKEGKERKYHDYKIQINKPIESSENSEVELNDEFF